MRSLNKVLLIGRLGRDPEIRYTPSGTPICTFSIATSSDYKDKEGKVIKQTDWHNITTFGKLAEICGEWLKKGSQVYIEGQNKMRTWTDKQNQKHYHHYVQCTTMQMLSSNVKREEVATHDEYAELNEEAPTQVEDVF